MPSDEWRIKLGFDLFDMGRRSSFSEPLVFRTNPFGSFELPCSDFLESFSGSVAAVNDAWSSCDVVAESVGLSLSTFCKRSIRRAMLSGLAWETFKSPFYSPFLTPAASFFMSVIAAGNPRRRCLRRCRCRRGRGHRRRCRNPVTISLERPINFKDEHREIIFPQSVRNVRLTSEGNCNWVIFVISRK